ncbi:nitrate reductase cytochrome c-type subunit [Aureispira anguillae]|uniref:Nitrate reductase cytochrome c-type subunit n=1 Tax=Aureispira anguillae TaxID=2864201 RepID=A0A915YL39_9BACT|nr:nitrate reductase cytochrome c-type subunit [Aureispira anguillae]BDS14763.1 nitrate reductase cytochrome c-type subunit [Aureispira anguillae]
MKKAFVIFLFISLIVGGKIVVDSALTGAMEGVDMSIQEKEKKLSVVEDGLSEHQETYNQMSIEDYTGRSLASYYKNRAYNGAPPTIPHPVANEMSIGGNTCLQCHQKGGFVNKYNAFAPVTPHPEKINCVQCHAAVKTNESFRASNWETIKNAAPILGQQAMEGSPPVIPHELTNFRDKNCLSCHAGPSAPKEIRVSHPERLNCVQCHAQQQASDVFYKTIK